MDKDNHQTVTKYLLKILVFSIPVMLMALFILVVDPYNYINYSSLIDDETKVKIFKRSDEVSPRGTLLWKALKYKRNPIKNVIIGDSQGTSIDEKLLKEITGNEYFNFCSPGSSYETMFDCFWYCAENCDLKSVSFQVGFMNFNSYRSYNLFGYAQDYFDKPYLYFSNKKIFFDSFYNTLYAATKNPDIVNKPKEFFQVDKQDSLSYSYLKMFFDNYSYPEEYIDELEAIYSFCKNNEIQLTFIILPVFEEVSEYIDKKGLHKEEVRFVNDLKSFGQVHDFSKDNEFAKERTNFHDFFHPTNSTLNQIIPKIWKRQL